MAAPQYRSLSYRRQRAVWAAAIASGHHVLCFRCERPIGASDHFHLDRVRPVCEGGAGGPLRPSHVRCNLSHGGQLGRRAQLGSMKADRRFGTAPPSVRWVADSYDRWAEKCRAAGYDPVEQAIAYGDLTVAEYLQSSPRIAAECNLLPLVDEPAEIF